VTLTKKETRGDGGKRVNRRAKSDVSRLEQYKERARGGRRDASREMEEKTAGKEKERTEKLKGG